MVNVGLYCCFKLEENISAYYDCLGFLTRCFAANVTPRDCTWCGPLLLACQTNRNEIDPTALCNINELRYAA